MLLLIPLTAASVGMLYGLYLHATTGQLSTVAKSYGTTSRTISFEAAPLWFLFFFALNVLLAAGIILLTVVMARLGFKAIRGRL